MQLRGPVGHLYFSSSVEERFALSIPALSPAWQVNQGGFFDLQLHFLATGNPPPPKISICVITSNQVNLQSPLPSGGTASVGRCRKCVRLRNRKYSSQPASLDSAESQEMDNNPRYGFRSLLCPFFPRPLHLISITPKSAPLKCH